MSQPSNVNVDDLLKQRGQDYDFVGTQAWFLAGEVLGFLQKRRSLDRVLMSPYSFAWIIILVKLIRLLATPTHLDSWKDIEGYARLVLDHVSKNTKEAT